MLAHVQFPLAAGEYLSPTPGEELLQPQTLPLFDTPVIDLSENIFAVSDFTVDHNTALSSPVKDSLSQALAAMIARAQRTELAEGAWIDLFPQWIAHSFELFSKLQAHIPWESEQRLMYNRVITIPRLHFTYKLDNPHTPASLLHMAKILSQYYTLQGYPLFASAGLCFYRNSHDSIAWHGDSVGKAQKNAVTLNANSTFPDVLIAIVSLGAARPLLLRPRNVKSKSRKFLLHSGDLLVMGGTCQSTWEHCIPKLAQELGPRISIQFRPAGVH